MTKSDMIKRLMPYINHEGREAHLISVVKKYLDTEDDNLIRYGEYGPATVGNTPLYEMLYIIGCASADYEIETWYNRAKRRLKIPDTINYPKQLL